MKNTCQKLANEKRSLNSINYHNSNKINLGVQSDLLDCLSLSLSVDDGASYDGPISPTEAHAALLDMARGKISGVWWPGNGLLCCFLGFAWWGSC